MIIVLEAIDNAGKSSQVELLEQYFKNQNKLVVRTLHFPDRNSRWGKEIYRWLNDKNNKVDYSKEVFELLQTIDKTSQNDYIKQFKNNDNWVLILDRYKLSQYSYALASGLDKNWTINLMSQYIEPDYKIFLNISPHETMKRKKENLDKYESDFEFQNMVYSYYLEGCREFNYNVIDANKSIDEIHKEIKEVIK